MLHWPQELTNSFSDQSSPNPLSLILKQDLKMPKMLWSLNWQQAEIGKGFSCLFIFSFSHLLWWWAHAYIHKQYCTVPKRTFAVPLQGLCFGVVDRILARKKTQSTNSQKAEFCSDLGNLEWRCGAKLTISIYKHRSCRACSPWTQLGRAMGNRTYTIRLDISTNN